MANTFSERAYASSAPLSFNDTRSSFVFPLLPTPRLIPISDRFAFRAGDPQSISDSLEDPPAIKYITSFELLELVVSEVLAGTIYADHFNIHQEYDPNALNIYFFNSHEINSISRHVGICQYIAPHPLIICHGDNINSFAKEITDKLDYVKLAIIQQVDDGSLVNLTKSDLDLEMQDVTNSLLAAGLLGWIIAHEVGHAVLHSHVRHAKLLFDGTASGRLESEADEFAAEQILSSEFLISNSLYSIDEIVERGFLEIGENPEKVVSILNSDARWASQRYKIRLNARSPRELLIYRGANIYREVARRDSFRDTTGYYEHVMENIVLDQQRWRLFVPDLFARLFALDE